jgi:ferritin
MLISKELEAAINAQVGNEFGASLQYVSIASYFDREDLPELTAFFFRQAEEENEHAMKFVDYINETGGALKIAAIPATRHDFDSAEDAVKAALDWEIEVTDQINQMMHIAVEQRDYIGQDFLRWFVSEQREEISTMSTLLSVVRRAGENNLLLVEQFVARTGHPEDAEGGEE